MGNSNREVSVFAAVDKSAHADLTSIDFENHGARGGYFTLDRDATAGSTVAFPIVRLQGKIMGTTEYFEFFRFTNTTSQDETNTILIHPDASTFGTASASTAFTAAQMTALPLPAVWRVLSTNTSTGEPIWGLSVNLVE